MSKKYYVGDIELSDSVDITDPCYDKDVWCRMTVKCQAGTYKGYADISDEGEWGMRVARISIYKDGNKVPLKNMECIGSIGVDAGLAGFFNNKPDFNDSEWSDFCDQIRNGEYWNLYNGIFSYSGYGDGEYKVYSNKERNAFVIVFI